MPRHNIQGFEKDVALNPSPLEDPADAEFDLVSVLQGKLAEMFTNLPDRLKTLSEFELCNEVDPGPTDYKMRQNFSDEVELAKKSGKKIKVVRLYEHLVSRQTFFDWYLSNQLKVAFFTRPVVTHNQYYDAIHKEGLRKLFLYVKTHDLDPKTMATFARIVEKAGDRAIGAVAQRIALHQKQEITHTSKSDEREVDSNDPVQIRAKIEELQARITATKAVEIDARVVDDDE